MIRQIIAILHAITQAIQSWAATYQQKQTQDSADSIADNPGSEWLRRFGRTDKASKANAGKPDNQ
jgi:hypothetical protein